MTRQEDIARRIADCLEQHLEEYGVELYRYPSGEVKGVTANFGEFSSTISVLAVPWSDAVHRGPSALLGPRGVTGQFELTVKHA